MKSTQNDFSALTPPPPAPLPSPSYPASAENHTPPSQRALSSPRTSFALPRRYVIQARARETAATPSSPQNRSGMADDQRPPRRQNHGQHGSRSAVEPRSSSSPSLSLDKLREAVSTVQGKSLGKLKSQTSSSSPGKMNMRKTVLEQQTTSPSLEAAFSSPLTGGARTGSTESTESTESARTIRGTAAPTSSQYPLRTPSYPFPYVPAERAPALSFPFHQPFTTLSPTVSSSHVTTRANLRDKYYNSTQSTPVDAPGFFGPQSSNGTSNGAGGETKGPNLYDIVLQLNCDPTLSAWWTTLTNILHEHYGIERASIALPADATDIENVPWGQKAAYNVAGLKTLDSNDQSTNRSISAESETSRSSSSRKSEVSENPSPFGTHVEMTRPGIESRHSYAGYEHGRSVGTFEGVRRSSPAARPSVSRRTTTHLSSVRRRSIPDPHQSPERPAPIHEHPDEVDASENGDTDYAFPEYPTAVILPTLRALEREKDALLDSSGVNRVLGRSRLVVLTRDYSIDQRRTVGQNNSASEAGHRTQMSAEENSNETISRDTPGASQLKPQARNYMKSRLFNKSTTSLHKSDLRIGAEQSPQYEDYEQFPSSPWAQSPAPSPAIQKDPEQNPFFATGNLDEESFSPTLTHEDYARYGQVEAIGVDKASTIIHVPLIHPLLSRKMSSPETSPTAQPSGRVKPKPDSEELERKVPLAILSVLSSDVPCPHHIIQSLRQLSPHLATSFQTSFQNTTVQERIAGAMFRQQQSHRAAAYAPIQLNSVGLGVGFESLLFYDPEDARSSTVGSLASPSDYSGRSRHSPVGSAAGTPGLEPSVHAPISRHPTGATPNPNTGAEPSENYFEAKKRMTVHRARSGGPVSLGQLSAQSTARASSSDYRSALRRIETSPVGRENSLTPLKKESKKTRVRDEKSSPADPSPMRKRSQPPSGTTETEETRHSVLHSHGADFSASFQSLPVAAVPRSSVSGPHTRSASMSDAFDMPPPSERLLRTIIDSLPVQIFTAAPVTGHVTWVNSKFLVYRGQTPRQVIEDPWETIHAQDLEGYMSEWQRSLHTGHQFQHKLRLRRFDDNYRWYYVRAAPLRDKLQNIVHWVGTMIDLHDQHVAEVNAAKQQETAASEAKYRALANSSPQIVFAATRTRGVTFCNDQWVAYSGQTEEQAKGTGFMDYVYPEDIIKCKLPTFDESGSPMTNAPLSVPSPLHRTQSGSSSTDNSEASNESNITMTGVTVTASGSHLPQRKLSELASVGILRISKDGTGKPSYSTEVRLRMKSGEYRWHLVRILLAEPLIQAEAEEETWYGTCTDINDHKELEQTLKETMDAKSRFLSNMSHEIRTPLNGISGMANFLIDSNLTPEQLDHVNVIRASTEGLRDLINDILDLSKVEAGMITLNMDWLHIRSVIEEVNDLTSSLALDKGIELNYLVEGNVPSMVKGDKFRFRQVLLNVIGNAIKFTQQGEVFIHCRLAPEEEIDASTDSVMLQIDVVDTGQGFTEKEAEMLFKRFSQIDGSSTRQHGGTGLGLVISMQLVELHGGIMTASSVPGQGSTFTFSIKFGLPAGGSPSTKVTGSHSQMSPSVRTDSEGPSRRATIVSSPVETPSPSNSLTGISMSPVYYAGLEQRPSPAVLSPSSSNPSVRTVGTSNRSSRSSQSSYGAESGIPIQLKSTTDTQSGSNPRPHAILAATSSSTRQNLSTQARAYSILVVCSLRWTRMATVGHLNSVLNHSIPHIITASHSLDDAQRKIMEPESFTFSHIVLILQEAGAVKTLVDVITSLPYSPSIVVVSDTSQRRAIVAHSPQFDFDQLAKDRKLQFVGKPIKPSRLAVIFDPNRSRELSTDHNQHSAQQIALGQKRIFDEMSRRLGNKDIKVLLVEDNRINQMVMLKLLRRVSVDVETCLDGVQATDKVLSKPAGYYSIILLDLMMPNKDGYQTCQDIRHWESQNKYDPIPIVALSANVLDDVWQRCKEAGFNSYLTKPVEFKELSDVMTAFLDPDDPSKPMEWMSHRPGVSSYKRGA